MIGLRPCGLVSSSSAFWLLWPAVKVGSCAHLWFLQKDGALMQTLWMMPPEKLQGILHAAETILQTAKRKRVMLFRALGKTLKCHGWNDLLVWTAVSWPPLLLSHPWDRVHTFGFCRRMELSCRPCG